MTEKCRSPPSIILNFDKNKMIGERKNGKYTQKMFLFRKMANIRKLQTQNIPGEEKTKMLIKRESLFVWVTV